MASSGGTRTEASTVTDPAWPNAAGLSAPAGGPVPIRVLCLGNDLLADDAFGCLAAEHLRRRVPGAVDVVFSTDGGFSLMDHLEGVKLLVVIDVVMTGKADPGAVSVFRGEDLRSAPGGSPHYVGLFESLALGRKLGLQVPQDVVFVVVEAADCLTIGGAMHPAVRSALPVVTERVEEQLAAWGVVAAA